MSSVRHDGTGWSLADPPNVAVFTVDAVLQGVPILRVLHDEEDGAWQFLDGSDVSFTKARVVSLAEVVGLDLSVTKLADLPRGWQATRATIRHDWVRKPQS